MIASLREAGLSELVSVEIDDSVEISLLDGMTYKTTESLSTGQRCTAVLPVLLRHDERVLIVDQPEDHLDNGFIVSTVVKAMKSRDSASQLIATTHNPNIPVLGDASRVSVMSSDGKRGFPVEHGKLTDPRIVDAITKVMEGGREAFERRAAFYSEAINDEF